MSEITKLESVLRIKFDNPDLCREALMHKSFATEHNVTYDNQRLELLGDAVVQIVLTRYLFDLYPDLREGDLTKIRSALANQDSLAAFARHISLGEHLMLGRGEAPGRDRDSTLADAYEALLAAIYLDQGLETASRFFLEIMGILFPEPIELLDNLNPKGALQEYTQKNGEGVPRYELISVSGPDHCPRYDVKVLIGGKVFAAATSTSRRLAERDAARLALEVLRKQTEQPDHE